MMQTTFETRFPQGYPGMPADVGIKYDRSYFNTALDTAGVVTVTVATFAADTEYELQINGVNVSYRSPTTGGSAAATRDALVAAVNQSFSGVDAAAATGNTFTLTGLPGQPISVGSLSSGLTQATTTAAVASGEIGLGLAVVRLLADSEREVRLGAPDASHRFVGVTIDDGQRTVGYPGENRKPNTYRRSDVMAVREAGSAWVRLDAPVTSISQPVFYRYVGAGVIGGFRGAMAAGADLQLANARFLTTGTEVAQLLLGYSTFSNGTTP